METKPGLSERLSAFHIRNERQCRAGFDRACAARFIVEAAGPINSPVMDIGTGKGFLAIELARMKLDVVSVDSDADEQALADMLAREAGVEGWIRFVKGDAAHLSHPDGCFGCAAMMDVLHHLENPDPVLLEMARVVWPEGLIVLAELDRKGFEFVERVHREEGRGHPNSSANLDQAVEKLTGAGFQCLKRTNGCMRDVAVLKKGRLSHG